MLLSLFSCYFFTIFLIPNKLLLLLPLVLPKQMAGHPMQSYFYIPSFFSRRPNPNKMYLTYIDTIAFEKVTKKPKNVVFCTSYYSWHFLDFKV